MPRAARHRRDDEEVDDEEDDYEHNSMADGYDHDGEDAENDDGDDDDDEVRFWGVRVQPERVEFFEVAPTEELDITMASYGVQAPKGERTVVFLRDCDDDDEPGSALAGPGSTFVGELDVQDPEGMSRLRSGPMPICTLLPGRVESVPLNLTITGPRILQFIVHGESGVALTGCLHELPATFEDMDEDEMDEMDMIPGMGEYGEGEDENGDEGIVDYSDADEDEEGDDEEEEYGIPARRGPRITEVTDAEEKTAGAEKKVKKGAGNKRGPPAERDDDHSEEVDALAERVSRGVPYKPNEAPGSRRSGAGTTSGNDKAEARTTSRRPRGTPTAAAATSAPAASSSRASATSTGFHCSHCDRNFQSQAAVEMHVRAKHGQK